MDQKAIPGFKVSPMDQCSLVTKEEMALAKQFLSDCGLTLEQAVKYVLGIEFAENMMPQKRSS
jgi:hypothetical protein